MGKAGIFVGKAGIFVVGKAGHPLVLALATNREVKEGRRFWPQTEKPRGERKAALLSPLGFGRKPRGEGRPRSFHPFGFGHKRRGEGRPPSFHPSDLATNREVKEGRAPFTPRFWPQAER